MIKIVRIILLLIPLLPTLLLDYDLATAAYQIGLDNFTPTPCMIELPIGVIEDRDVICGYVTVPEQHSIPDGDQIQLAVLIIKSQSTNPKPDPLFLAQGGPGGSTIETYGQFLLTDPVFNQDRDIVLFDQRGTFYSKPNLMCPEIDEMILEHIEEDLPDDVSAEIELDALANCRDRLLAEGVNPSAYDSLENAADINALRIALGYEHLNLYGVSYGTLLALHTMRNHPEMLRSVILDAVVPPDRNFILDAPTSIDQAYSTLFSACASDPNCNKTYPDLENVYLDLFAELERNPVQVPITDPDSKITYQSIFDGETFQWGLFQMLYATSLIPALPRMIYDASNGEFGFFGRIISIVLFDRTMSYGMYYSVICAEDADFSPADYDLTNIRPQIAQAEENSAQNLLNVCEIWAVEPLMGEIDAPVASDIPTLILSGGFDPITPPIYGNAVADTLLHSYEFIFPAGGHGQALEGDCQNQIIQDFLTDPLTPPASDCISKIQEPDFFTPRNLVDVPGIIRLLNLENNSGFELLIFVISYLYLLSAILILPLNWLYKKLRRNRVESRTYYSDFNDASLNNLNQLTLPGDQTQALRKTYVEPFPRRYADVIAILNGIILTISLTAILVIVFQMVLNNDNRLLFGLSAESRIWVMLIGLFTLLCFAMIIISVQSWRKDPWPLWKRIYYASISLASLMCVWVLIGWGFFESFF